MQQHEIEKFLNSLESIASSLKRIADNLSSFSPEEQNTRKNAPRHSTTEPTSSFKEPAKKANNHSSSLPPQRQKKS